ncbi:unnamed protein product, partial [Prorocentrum cordatum]
SLALALNGQLWEVCELCYLLALARQHAWRAQLTSGERAVLLEQARHLTALLAALAGLADEMAGGVPVGADAAAAEVLRRWAAAEATPTGARELQQVAPARGLLRYPPSALPFPLAAEALRCCPPAAAPGGDAPGAPPGAAAGVGAALVGALAALPAPGGGPPLGAPPAPGPFALPGAAAAGAGGGGMAAAAGPAPAGSGVVALARLVDGPWVGSPALQHGAFTAGMVLETPTHDPTGQVDGAAFVEVVEAGAPGPDGVYFSVNFQGASLPARALELDLSFPAPGAGQPGVLRLCAGGAAACRASRLVGRGERHADWLRLRAAAGYAAAAAAAEAAGPAARPLVPRRRRREQSRSESEERAAGDQLDSRDAPSRGNAVQAVADGRPGTLCDEAIAQIARVMGLREGADGQRIRPRIRGYLQAVVLGHHPIHSVWERTVRELQTLAAALDLLEGGSLASVAGTLMQRFKALEMALNDGNWYIANEPEVVEGIRPTLASRDEQESARRSAMLRRRLEEAASGPRVPQPLARPRGRLAGAAPTLGPRRRRAAWSCWTLPMSAPFGKTSQHRRSAGGSPGAGREPEGRGQAPRASGAERGAAGPRAAGALEGPRQGPLALEARTRSADDARGEADPLGPAGARADCVGDPGPPADSLAAGREAARAEAAWPDADAPLEFFRAWQEKAGAVAESFRRPLDAGPILEELTLGFPGALGVYVDKFMHSGHRPTRRGRLQRDLLPLPCPDLEASDFAVEGEIDPGDLTSLQSRLRVIVMAMNWGAGYRHLKWADVCGPEPNAAQRSALLGIARRIYSSVAPEPVMAGALGWSEKLKDRAIAYDGSEVSTPSRIALEQIEGGLPPVGVAASIEAADLAAGFVRAALLDPSLVLLPPAQRRPAPTSTRVWATSQEWELVVSALFARGMVGPVDEAEIATRDGAPLINGAFGVAKVHDAPVSCGDGEERPVLRLIVNLIPANACQRTVAGDTPVMPTMGQLNGLVRAPGGQLLWGGAHRKAFFYVFRAPPAWRPYMALGPPVPRRLVGGSGDGLTRIALRVISMGWISAVGVTTYLHRNMLRRSASAPRGLPPAAEVARARRLPAEAQASGVAMWFVYVDNLEIAEPRSVSTLGGLVDGEAGVRRPPLGYLAELASLTLCFLAKRRPSRRLAQILLGRWVRVQCYRRPLAAAFVNAWKWLASGRSGGLITLGVAEDLLIAAALAPLSVADMRLAVDHLVAASDASEAAGAIVYSQGLSDMGRALGARGPRALNPACEEAVALISVFSGIDGARRAFEILGLAQAAHLSFEVGAEAVRVARRAFPSTVHLGDVAAADPVIVIGRFPCQGYAVLNVAREGSADPRSQLVGHMWRLIEGLKRELPEATVDFLGENAASMAEDEVLALNKMFGRVPVSLDAADLGWVRRPRLYWLSWDLLRSFEMTAEMKAAAAGDGAAARLGCTPKEVARWTAAGYAAPPYQFRDCFCLHWADGRKEPPRAVEREVLMGFRRGHTLPCVSSSAAKSHPERYEALRRSLVGNSFQCEVVAWLLSHWAVHHSLLVAVPSLRSLRESSRSWSMGRKLWAGDVEALRCGREAVCEDNLRLLEEAGRAPAAGAGPEARAIYVGRGSRRWGLGPSKWGNPCPVVPGRPAGDAVALFAGWLRSQPELLDQPGRTGGSSAALPLSLGAALPRGRPAGGAGAARQGHQRVVASLVITCHHSGADLRVDTDAETYGKMFPRQEIDAGIWKWKVARQLVWQDQAKHINVLECEAALMALRWRARSASRQMCVFLHLLDAVVNIGALAKRRSSSQQLNKVVRAFSILELALGSRAVFAFTSSAKNPVDAPSRLPNG